MSSHINGKKQSISRPIVVASLPKRQSQSDLDDSSVKQNGMNNSTINHNGFTNNQAFPQFSPPIYRADPTFFPFNQPNGIPSPAIPGGEKEVQFDWDGCLTRENTIPIIRDQATPTIGRVVLQIHDDTFKYILLQATIHWVFTGYEGAAQFYMIRNGTVIFQTIESRVASSTRTTFVTTNFTFLDQSPSENSTPSGQVFYELCITNLIQGHEIKINSPVTFTGQKLK